jgi:hypothetical protein
LRKKFRRLNGLDIVEGLPDQGKSFLISQYEMEAGDFETRIAECLNRCDSDAQCALAIVKRTEMKLENGLLGNCLLYKSEACKYVTNVNMQGSQLFQKKQNG